MFTNHKYEKILALIFLCSLPLVNPWVRGDGVGYYAYVRSLLIDHDLHFDDEWLAANPTRVKVGGRMMFQRIMGKASFAKLQDRTGQIQIFLQA